MRGRKTWVLVADGSAARVLESTGRGQALTLVESFEAASPLDQLEDADRPGRVHESHDTARHSLRPEQSIARKTAQAFGSHLADFLSQAVQQNAFESLILVASPKLLGDLKDRISKRVADRVIGTVDKDLTRESDAEIARRLTDIAPI